MLGLTWVAGLLHRRSLRLTGACLGVAVAVGLLASVGAFLSSAKASMTSHAASTVAVDWQVEVQPGADPAAVLDTVASSPGTRGAVPVDFVSASGFTARTGDTTQATGGGVVVGLPPDYQAIFPASVRPLVGASLGVLLTQQAAANLHARPGDWASVTVPGAPPAGFRVDGVVDLPHADSLFQKVGAPPGAQPSAPPDNVLIVPNDRWHAAFDGLASRPDLVRHQVHVALQRHLPSDPTVAFTAVAGAARNLEARLAGTGVVGDNLGAALDAARSDALYAQVLFLVLGLPGALLAGGLTAAVGASGAERRRQEQALLRARGATRRQMVRLSLAEALFIGLAGSGGGLGVAAAVSAVQFGSANFGATAASSAGWAVGTAAVGGLIAALTVAVPAYRDATRLTVASSRRRLTAFTQPRWADYGLDFALLVAAGVVVWLTTRAGYNLVLAPEGVPSISVSYWALLGPLFAWIGAGLLVWRLASGVLGRGSHAVRYLLRPLTGALATTVTASLGRQRRRLATAVVIVALTGAFAGSTAVFNSTYSQQVGVDARLTNGADVTVTEPPSSTVGPGDAARIAAVPGVRHVEPLEHRFAYVGTDLQDLYGIHPSTITQATSLENAYFSGGTAQQLLSQLAARPDGILVSAETVRDFQLQPGDLLRLRLSDGSTGALRTIPFRYVGVVKEFPTAPKDSFLVANANYIAAETHSPAVGAFLVDTGSAPPTAVVNRIRSVAGSATVTDIQTSHRLVGSSLTAIDLSGLTRVELGFAVALAAGASGLLMALVLAERRRTLTIATALGARTGQVASFARSEAAFVVTSGLFGAVAAAWMLAEILVRVLTGVFDPAPSHLAVPWGYLLTVGVLVLVAAAAAAELTVRASRRPVAEVLRDL